jgi:hypothetical protein
MAKQEYEFTLILCGVRELTHEVLDSLYEAGCDDALIGMRDGVAYAEFCREAESFQQALLSGIRDVEAAGAGARVEHVEPDELVTMSEIARRLGMTREGVRKRVAGLRGPGNFPPPAGSLTQRSPLWHWADVLRWHGTHLQQADGPGAGNPETAEVNRAMSLGSHLAAVNAALELLRRVPVEEALDLLQSLAAPRGEKQPAPAAQKAQRSRPRPAPGRGKTGKHEEGATAR